MVVEEDQGNQYEIQGITVISLRIIVPLYHYNESIHHQVSLI